MEVQRRAPTGPRRRGGGRGRPDRDGDMKMDLPIKGRSRIGKASAVGGAHSSARKELLPRSARGNLLSANAQRAIARHVGRGDVAMKETRANSRGLEELKVTGWEKSKAVQTSNDGGVGALIKWLEKKASLRLGSGRRDVKIKKSRRAENILFISVPSEDAGALLRMDGFVWAQAKVTIARVNGSGHPPAQLSSEAEKTKQMLRGVLERRYNPDIKLLDLSNLSQDEELKAQAIFNTNSTASKFFPAMMRILELAFDTTAERDAAVESVTLANNDLVDLRAVSSLSETLPKLHNLDLSNNKFENLSAVMVWRRRFHFLQHLIISNNPLEQNEPNYGTDLVKWYPSLRMLNNLQVRTEEEIAAKTKTTALPFPIRSALFQDEGGIAESFVRTFFRGLDEDRAGLVAHYYDDSSEFSYALNTAAPRDPAGTEKTEKQEWELYIRHSRNLKKISQLGSRQNRSFKGLKTIADIITSLPKTRHPDLASEARKWMIEAHIQPCIPDPTGQSPSGVDGFCITVHTEFDEIDPSTGQHTKKRSVDHVFMIGPGGPGGVRIHTHQFTVRAYGGAQAFQAEDHGPSTPPPQQAVPLDAVPQLPAGLSIETAEQMVGELTKQTNLTLEFSKQCLEQTGWDFQAALVAFANAKPNLPPQAFLAA